MTARRTGLRSATKVEATRRATRDPPPSGAKEAQAVTDEIAKLLREDPTGGMSVSVASRPVRGCPHTASGLSMAPVAARRLRAGPTSAAENFTTSDTHSRNCLSDE
jgi:hypothetical protein